MVFAGRSAIARWSPHSLFHGGSGSARRAGLTTAVDVFFPSCTTVASSSESAFGAGEGVVASSSEWWVLDAKSGECVSGLRPYGDETRRERAIREGLGSPSPHLVAGCVNRHPRNMLAREIRSFTSLTRSSHPNSTTCAPRVEMGHRPCLSANVSICLLYTSPSPRDATLSRMPSSA